MSGNRCNNCGKALGGEKAKRDRELALDGCAHYCSRSCCIEHSQVLDGKAPECSCY